MELTDVELGGDNFIGCNVPSSLRKGICRAKRTVPSLSKEFVSMHSYRTGMQLGTGFLLRPRAILVCDEVTTNKGLLLSQAPLNYPSQV